MTKRKLLTYSQKTQLFSAPYKSRPARSNQSPPIEAKNVAQRNQVHDTSLDKPTLETPNILAKPLETSGNVFPKNYSSMSTSKQISLNTMHPQTEGCLKEVVEEARVQVRRQGASGGKGVDIRNEVMASQPGRHVGLSDTRSKAILRRHHDSDKNAWKRVSMMKKLSSTPLIRVSNHSRAILFILA